MEFINTAYMCVCKPTPAYVGDLHRNGDRGRMNLHARYLRISSYSLDASNNCSDAQNAFTHTHPNAFEVVQRLSHCQHSLLGAFLATSDQHSWKKKRETKTN